MNPELLNLLIDEYKRKGYSARTLITHPDFQKMPLDKKLLAMASVRDRLREPLTPTMMASIISKDVVGMAGRGAKDLTAAAAVTAAIGGLSHVVQGGHVGDYARKILSVSPTLLKYTVGVGAGAGAILGAIHGIKKIQGGLHLANIANDSSTSDLVAAARAVVAFHGSAINAANNKLTQDITPVLEDTISPVVYATESQG